MTTADQCVPDQRLVPQCDQAEPHAGTSSGRWLECVSHLDPKFGGLSAVVPQLASRLVTDYGFSMEIAAFSEEDETGALSRFPMLAGGHWPQRRAAWFSPGGWRDNFRRTIGLSDGVHIHGIWETHAAVAASAARQLAKPYIVSAHGMLEPWALNQKGLKKKLYSALIERGNLNQAACLHALTEAEVEDYRRFGCRRPVAVIPNAVEIPAHVDRSLFVESFPEVGDKRFILFLGRLHPKKGLSLLIEAWEKVCDLHPDVNLVIAGPDENNYRSQLAQLIEERRITGRVLFTGMLDSDRKWSALASAICFVLPSFSEGFSMAVLEAMGMGVPVIVTKQCHVTEVSEAHAGWEISPAVDELTVALEEVLRNNLDANQQIGNRGREVVSRKFSWKVVARQMAGLYRWVQGGARPSDVEILEVNA